MKTRSTLFSRVLVVVVVAGVVAVAASTLAAGMIVHDHEEAGLAEATLADAERRAARISNRLEVARGRLLAAAFAVHANRLLAVPSAAEETTAALLAFQGGEEVLEAARDERALAALRAAGEPGPEGVAFLGRHAVLEVRIDDVRAVGLIDLASALGAPPGTRVRVARWSGDGDPALSAQRSVDGQRVRAEVPLEAGHVLVVDAPLAPARSAAAAVTARLLGWSSLALIPLLVLAWLLSRAVTGPVRRLSSAVRAADGPVELPPLRDDEIGDLGAAIQQMSAQLHADARAMRVAVRFGRQGRVDDRAPRVLAQLSDAFAKLSDAWTVVVSPAHREALAVLGTSPELILDRRETTRSSVPEIPPADAVRMVSGHVVIALDDGERLHGVVIGSPAATDRELKMAEIVVRTALERLRNATLGRRLIASEKLAVLGRLAASVAHEMNTPLAFVKANLFAMEPDVGLPGRAALDDARLGVDRLERIVRDLTALSAGGAMVSHEAADLGSLVRDMVKMARARRPQGSVDVVAEPNAYTECDRGRIEQVLLNLVNNALDAVGERGNVVVRVRRWRDQVRVEVEDDGPGVSDEVRRDLFEAFVTSKGHQGTGLGLYLSRSFAEAHGGSLELVRSDASGTVFRLELPASAAPKAHSTQPPSLASSPPAAHGGRIPRVLVVDDEPALVRAMTRWLTPRARVTGTTEPRRALELIRREPFDLILCDMHMPDMNGRELVAQLRGRDPEAADRVVIVTGSGGAPPPGLRVVRKPIGPKVLDQLIGSLDAAEEVA